MGGGSQSKEQITKVTLPEHLPSPGCCAQCLTCVHLSPPLPPEGPAVLISVKMKEVRLREVVSLA